LLFSFFWPFFIGFILGLFLLTVFAVVAAAAVVFIFTVFFFGSRARRAAINISRNF